MWYENVPGEPPRPRPKTNFLLNIGTYSVKSLSGFESLIRILTLTPGDSISVSISSVTDLRQTETSAYKS